MITIIMAVFFEPYAFFATDHYADFLSKAVAPLLMQENGLGTGIKSSIRRRPVFTDFSH